MDAPHLGIQMFWVPRGNALLVFRADHVGLSSITLIHLDHAHQDLPERVCNGLCIVTRYHRTPVANAKVANRAIGLYTKNQVQLKSTGSANYRLVLSTKNLSRLA